MAVGGIGAIVAQAPAGALVDRTTAKRALIIGGALTITLGSLATPLFPGFYSVSVLQALTGIAGSVFAPALGVGAAVSNLVAGSIVVAAGYHAAFASLGAIAAAGFTVYMVAMPETAPAPAAGT